jgi:hypothetical protein
MPHVRMCGIRLSTCETSRPLRLLIVSEFLPMMHAESEYQCTHEYE